MYHYSGKPVKEKIAIAECIETVLRRNEIKSDREDSVLKQASYVDVKPIDTMVAEDSSTYNVK